MNLHITKSKNSEVQCVSVELRYFIQEKCPNIIDAGFPLWQVFFLLGRAHGQILEVQDQSRLY